MKRIELSDRHSMSELDKAAGGCKDGFERLRMLAIIKTKENKSRVQIAKELKVSRRTLTIWIKNYNEQGLMGLKTKTSGRKEGNPKWPLEIFERLSKEIDDTERYWSIPLMADWIFRNYNKRIPQQTIWYQLRKLGYSCSSSRPHPYKANPKTQQEFKKRALVFWSKN